MEPLEILVKEVKDIAIGLERLSFRTLSVYTQIERDELFKDMQYLKERLITVYVKLGEST